MAYLGVTPTTSSQSLVKQDFSVSATQNYTLSQSVNNANDIALYINNVRQEPTYAYSASGTSLTLTAATAGTDDMYCIYLGRAVGTVNPASGSVGTSQLANLGVTGAKLNTDAISAQTELATEPADTDEFLVSDGGVLKRIDYSHIKGGGYYVLLNTTTASAASSVVFDSSLMTNTYRHFMITGNAFYAGANNSFLSYRESSDNGNTHSFTGKNAYLYTTIGTNSTGGYGDSTSNYFYLGSWNSGSGKPYFAQWDLYNFAHAEPTGGFKKYRVKCFQHNANANVYYIDSQHTSSNGGAMNRFEIWFPSTTITGTFKLYGVL